MRIVLGLTGCVDYEVCWDTRFLQCLITDMKLCVGDLVRPSSISSQRDLVVSILCYLKQGRGGEEYVQSKETLLDFANHFSYKTTLGGTSVRAGIALAKMGIASTVHVVSINPIFSELAPNEITFIANKSSLVADPHLIIQYPTNVTLCLSDGSITSQRPNRLIYVNDEPNAQVAISPQLSNLVGSADVLLFSGINGIRDKSIIDKKSKELMELSSAMNADMLCVYEEAAFHVDSFKYTINAALAGVVDIRSMNEDEAQRYLNKDIDLEDEIQIKEMFKGLRCLFPDEVIVVHTQNWAAASGISPKIAAEQIVTALEKGVNLAATRFRYGDNLSRQNYLNITKLPSADSTSILMNKLARSQIYGVPSVDIHIDTPTTIGLGDTFCGGLLWGLSELLDTNTSLGTNYHAR